jgi:hypothetical protein
MPGMSSTIHLLHLSYREMLSEADKPEPRLHRLLAHSILYENVSRQQLELEQEVSSATEEQTGGSTNAPKSCHTFVYEQDTGIQSSTPKLRTLADIQAFIHSQTEASKPVVTTEEISSDSDSYSDWESDDTLRNDSEEESDCSDNVELFQSNVYHSTTSLPLHNAKGGAR